jgi:hypothetical protein
MNFLERINATLHDGLPDQVPFAPYDNLVPRGSFERELRSRGMGLCKRISTISASMPNVIIEQRVDGLFTTHLKGMCRPAAGEVWAGSTMLRWWKSRA